MSLYSTFCRRLNPTVHCSRFSVLRKRKLFKMNGNGVVIHSTGNGDSHFSGTANGVGGGQRGALIVLEGCDKAGKSTQCKLLVDALNRDGKICHLFNFPDRTTDIGKMIDQYLKCKKSLSDEAIHLLFSSNRWEVAPTIRSLLEKGESVIVDRYAFSGVAFTAAKGTLDLEWCKSPDRGLPQPDRVFFLNLSEEAAAVRGDYGQERYEKKEFQKKVKDIFLQIQDPEYWKIIDADKSKEDLHRELYKLSVDSILGCGDNPILPLWKN